VVTVALHNTTAATVVRAQLLVLVEMAQTPRCAAVTLEQTTMVVQALLGSQES
jgi:hypothetical protein